MGDLNEFLRLRAKQLRLSHGLTMNGLANKLGCSPSKVSYLESGKTEVSLSYIEELCAVTESDANVIFSGHDLTIYDLEKINNLIDNSNFIKSYVVLTVPLTLQTEGYSSAVMLEMGQSRTWNSQEIKERINLRRGVKEKLQKKHHEILIHEAAFYQLVGSHEVMFEQIEQLYNHFASFEIIGNSNPLKSQPSFDYMLFDGHTLLCDTMFGVLVSLNRQTIFVGEEHFEAMRHSLYCETEKQRALEKACVYHESKLKGMKYNHVSL